MSLYQTLKKNYLSKTNQLLPDMGSSLTVLDATIYISLRIPLRVELKHDQNGNIVSAKSPKYAYLSIYEPELDLRRFLLQYVEELTRFKLNPQNHLVSDFLRGIYSEGYSKRRFNFVSARYFNQFITTIIELIAKLYVPINSIPAEVLIFYPQQLIKLNLMEHEYIKKAKLKRK